MSSPGTPGSDSSLGAGPFPVAGVAPRVAAAAPTGAQGHPEAVGGRRCCRPPVPLPPGPRPAAGPGAGPDATRRSVRGGVRHGRPPALPFRRGRPRRAADRAHAARPPGCAAPVRTRRGGGRITAAFSPPRADAAASVRRRSARSGPSAAPRRDAAAPGASRQTRSSTSRPSYPPSQARAGFRAAAGRPSGPGTYGGLVRMRSKDRSRTGRQRFPRTDTDRQPASQALTRAVSTARHEMSTAVTRAPRRAAASASGTGPGADVQDVRARRERFLGQGRRPGGRCRPAGRRRRGEPKGESRGSHAALVYPRTFRKYGGSSDSRRACAATTRPARQSPAGGRRAGPPR